MTVEEDRLDALRSLAILDTPPEAEFDSLVKAASTACGTPLAFLSLVDADRLWFKAGHGAPGLAEAPRASNFCNEAIAGDDLFEVPDAAADPRFKALGAVQAADGVRFYAGAPIRLDSGHRVGTVCVFDTVPRRLSPAQREVLRCLALAAARGLEARKALMAERRIAQSLQEAMAELDRSRDRLRRHYEATPAMLHSIDADGRLVMVSDLWLTKLGYRRDEVIGRLSTDFLTEASRHVARTWEIPSFFRKGRCDNVPYQMVTKSGALMDVRMSAVLDRSSGPGERQSLTVIEDVTMRLRIERALQESEANYRRLAEATSDVITQVDMSLRRSYVSPASRIVLGYAPDEMLGRQPVENVHPEDVERVRAVFEQVVAGAMPGDRTMVTYRSRHKQGHWIWLEVGLNLVRDLEDGTPRHMICALRDVSERRRIAEEIEAARAAAERAARSKAEFLANMSHELRTPLTGLLGVHDLLAGEPGLTPRQKDHLALARDAGRSLMAVINDVLDFSKMEAGQLTVEAVPFEVGALLSACRTFVRQEAVSKGLGIETQAPKNLHLVGDPMRLRQVLLNLVANAVKFTAAGRVSIGATYDAAAGRLRLQVSDTGIGIAPDQLTTIFERFRQADGSTSRRFGGTGLGLAICRHLVEAMGGRIDVMSAPGVGTSFTVQIPAAVAAVPENGVPEDIRMAAVPRRVLLAEDNRLNRIIIAEMLGRAGHHVTAAENGAEAVARVRDDAPYDAVLMDIQMPLLDGISATRMIRDQEASSGRRVFILGVTANATPEHGRDCKAAGLDGHLPKPIRWDDLLARLDALGGSAPALPADEPDDPCPPVLDHDTLAALARIIGPERVAAMLRSFVDEVQDRLVGLLDMPEDELLGCVHGWTSMAGHFGFAELHRHAADLHADARSGRSVAGIEALRAAAERAVLAGKNSHYATAA